MELSEAELQRLENECAAAGVLDFYFEMVKSGEPPRGAHMLALRSPPRTRNTDRTFCEGQQHKMSRMGTRNRTAMQALARKAGINTDGKYYIGGPFKYTDPRAWVTCQQDAIEAVKSIKGSSTGALNCDYSEKLRDPPKKVPLAPDIVNRFVRKRLKADPALAEKVKKNPKKLREVQEAVVSKHGARLGRT